MRPAMGFGARIDPQSRQILRRLVLLVVVFAAWSATVGIRRPLVVFAFMTFVAAWVELGIAALRHEKVRADRLGGWDLAAALFGLHCLATGLA